MLCLRRRSLPAHIVWREQRRESSSASPLSLPQRSFNFLVVAIFTSFRFISFSRSYYSNLSSQINLIIKILSSRSIPSPTTTFQREERKKRRVNEADCKAFMIQTLRSSVAIYVLMAERSRLSGSAAWDNRDKVTIKYPITKQFLFLALISALSTRARDTN